MSINDLLYTEQLKGIITGAVMMSGAGCVPKLARPYTEQEAEGFWAEVRERAGAADEETFRPCSAGGSFGIPSCGTRDRCEPLRGIAAGSEQGWRHTKHRFRR